MPFCHKCGNEIDEDAKFCPNCGSSQVITQPVKEKIIVTQKPSSIGSSIAVAAFLIIILIGGFAFAAVIELFDCPHCNNSPLLRWACSYCDGDGKVTLIQLITYSARFISYGRLLASGILIIAYKVSCGCMW